MARAFQAGAPGPNSSDTEYGMVPPKAFRTLEPAHRTRKRTRGAKRIRNKELPSFTRQLAAMLSAGLPILSALDGLADQTENPRFRALIRQMEQGIREGKILAETMREHPDIFDDLYCNMINAGEMTGKTAETADRLADFLDERAQLRRKVRSALCYPVIVLMIATAISTFMIVWIVPIFGQMFAGFDAELPAPTQALMRVSQFVRRTGLWIVLAAALLSVLFRLWRRTPAGGYAVDRLLLKTPIAGTLIQKIALSRFARTYAQLSQSGVSLLSAIEILAGSTGNQVFRRAVAAAEHVVEQGNPMSAALARCPHFPPLIIHMLSAGEKVGKADMMMQHVAAFYEDEVRTMLDGLMALMEPLLIGFLGIVVGGIVICMFMPIFKLPEIVGM